MQASAAAAAFATLALVVATGCGSGSSGDDASSGGSSLAIRAHWEQPPANALRTRALRGSRDASFGAAIPAAVNTVRITLEPNEGSSVPGCCIAVPRGSQAFVDRRLVLGALPAGDVLVRISGYPGSFAPSDGIGGDCVTVPSGVGASCDGGRTALPSFASNDVPVTVVAGQQASTGDVAIASLPFLLDVSPPEGTLVNVAAIPIGFAVVSANNTIVTGSITVSVQAGTQTFGATINSRVPCDDRGAGGTRCTNGPDLDVAGVLVGAVSNPVPAGPARILISAQDNVGRSVAFAYDVNVQPGATTTLPPTTTTLPPPTTTSTATTPTSSTTHTTVQTTTTTAPTTTLPPASICAVTFGVTSSETLLGLEYTTDYNAASGRFQRASEGPGCVSIRAGVFLVQSVDSEPNRLLLHQLNSSTPFANPGPLVKCNFLTDDTAALDPSDFVIQSVNGLDAQNNPVTPSVAVTNVDCGGGTTTTAPVTTTSTVTTSTVTTTTVTSTTLPATTTTITSTTTTTGTSPTTTLPGFVCTMGFAITNSETIERIDWEVNYQQAPGRFFKPGEGVRCASGDPNAVLMFVLDNTSSRIVDSRVQTPLGFSTPGALAVCLFLTPDNAAVSASDFIVNVLSAVRPDGTTANPALQLFQFQCVPIGGGGGTTTTTLATSVDNCDITFGWTTSDVIASLEYRANYTETGGRFEGFTSDVQCTALVATAGQGFEDKEDGNLVALMEAPSGIAGPTDVARCRYHGPAPAGFEGAISVSTLLARDATGAQSNAVMTITKVQCGL